MHDQNQIHQHLRESFGSRGFLFIGVTDLNVAEDHSRFMNWLDAGNHAGMDFLSRNADVRGDLQRLLPGAKSAVVFALPYAPAEPLKTAECGGEAQSAPRIAKYARLRDYHKIMWQEGDAAFSAATQDPAAEHRVCVDSAPVLERALAAKVGSGFIGKNTCFIAGKQGSFLLLGVILTTLEIAPTITLPEQKSRRNANTCGSCQRCQTHCPTGALDQAWNLDSRRCISYWTIENRGTIPEEFWPWLGKYWYGCDICQDVCPYNRTGEKLQRSDLQRPVEKLSLVQVATMDQELYERTFGGTAMTRAKRNGLRRNAMIAMAVTKIPGLESVLKMALQDDDPVIQETARQIMRWPPLSS